MIYEGDPIGGSCLRIKEPEAVAAPYLGRREWGHIPDHLAYTPVLRGGNLWPSLLSLRGRQTGGKAW